MPKTQRPPVPSIALMLAIPFFLVLNRASAASFSEKCPNLAACVKAVSDLTGQKYVYDRNLKEIAATSTANLQLTRENADELFTYALYQEGLTRVPLSEPNTYSIQRAREARDAPLPAFKANQTTTPALPETHDLVQLTYALSNEGVEEHIAMSLRTFLPANSRVVPQPVNRSIIVTDSAKNVKRLIPMIRELDQKPTAALKARWKEMEQERKKAREAARKEDS